MGTVLSASSMTSQTSGKSQSKQPGVHRQIAVPLSNHFRIDDPRSASASVISLPSEDIYHVTRPCVGSLNAPPPRALRQHQHATSSASLTDVFDWKQKKKLANIFAARRPAIVAMTTREKFKNSLSKLFSRLSWLKLDQMVFNDARNNNNINASVDHRSTTAAVFRAVDNRTERSSSSSGSRTPSDVDLTASGEFVIATRDCDAAEICSPPPTTTTQFYRHCHRTDNNLNSVLKNDNYLPESNPLTARTLSSDVINVARRFPRHAIVQASTSDLLFCLGEYLRRSCGGHVTIDLRPSDVSAWLRDVDQSLIGQGWQETPFVNPANVVFVFLLVRSEMEFLMNDDDYDAGDMGFLTLPRFRSNRARLQRRAWVGSLLELKTICLTCLYLAYSYMGSEISYPLRQFLVVGNGAAALTGCGVGEAEDVGALRGRFWTRCLRIVSSQSYFMLRINKDPRYFADVFADLISYSTIY